ncbi:hypothetical protein Cgig2_025250 [Carnegiea gigantea]|uniref:DUF4283 domain-containing protein n=1 Tax=Carnegiea gigantea TaxID=171969 RepID=A0A9Q1JF40_9CARY|nr:hypothetical protein Cgig2_025250 [Carnegiea gigantea]
MEEINEIVIEQVAQQANQAKPKSSHASLADPDDGIKLKFMPTEVINRIKVAKINLEDVKMEIDCWLLMNLTRLYRVESRNGFETEEIKSLPIWAHFPDLDVKLWGNESLSKIGSILGIPLKIDKHTRDKMMIRYARLLINISLEGTFLEYIEFFNEHGILMRQQVVYEWKLVNACIIKCLDMRKAFVGRRLEIDWSREERMPYQAQLLPTCNILVQRIDQVMHCHATQASTNKKFYITYVYGQNQPQQ